MAYLIDLKTFTDNRGNLTVIEDTEIPFKIKRTFFIYGVDSSTRATHRHKTTIQALYCIQGSCEVYNNNGIKKEIYVLNQPRKCLILMPEDWHKIYNFTTDCILQVLASEYFDPEDYIFGEYV
ncbi:MAG: FdtA/QdtA family cupin domain-containing protein [Candidatus Gastranaerophilales bacterium]|nr:FdtA/QdtA family cupin domain-containing protein [Candidatus Gastranaerophilales bacterium]